MMRRSILAVLIAALAIPAIARAQQPSPEKAAPMMLEVSARSLQWMPVEQPGFPPGLEIAVISGDPGKEEPYTVRLRFPDGYRFPGHFHPKDEHLTILSGTFILGMGAKTDESKLKTYAAGDYLLVPASTPHFGKVQGETIIQLHGIGPFTTTVTEEIAGAIKQ